MAKIRRHAVKNRRFAMINLAHRSYLHKWGALLVCLFGQANQAANEADISEASERLPAIATQTIKIANEYGRKAYKWGRTTVTVEEPESWRFWYLLGFGLISLAGGVAFLAWIVSSRHHSSVAVEVGGVAGGVGAVLMGLYLVWGWFYLKRKHRQ